MPHPNHAYFLLSCEEGLSSSMFLCGARWTAFLDFGSPLTHFLRHVFDIYFFQVPDAAQQAIIETTVQFEISRLTQENIVSFFLYLHLYILMTVKFRSRKVLRSQRYIGLTDFPTD